MRKRCLQKNQDRFKDYGGRGITICDRWLGENGFENFMADMGLRPSGTHSIDRFPDKNGNYESDNCRWATVAEQNNNRRKPYNSLYMTAFGQTLSVADWARTKYAIKSGVPRQLLRSRVVKYGWTVEEALTRPAGPIGRRGPDRRKRKGATK